jgi:hypothetical protein
MKKEIEVENIEGLAEVSQKFCYPSGAHPIQLAETKQFFIMGFFEGMQIGNKIPRDKFDELFLEVSDSIQNRIQELMTNKK